MTSPAVIADKLVNRHPHVFGETRLPDSAAVLRQWEVIKRAEKQERRSVLDGVPKALPALARAQKVQGPKQLESVLTGTRRTGPWQRCAKNSREIESAPENRSSGRGGRSAFCGRKFRPQEGTGCRATPQSGDCEIRGPVPGHGTPGGRSGSGVRFPHIGAEGSAVGRAKGC